MFHKNVINFNAKYLSMWYNNHNLTKKAAKNG